MKTLVMKCKLCQEELTIKDIESAEDLSDKMDKSGWEFYFDTKDEPQFFCATCVKRGQ